MWATMPLALHPVTESLPHGVIAPAQDEPRPSSSTRSRCRRVLHRNGGAVAEVVPNGKALGRAQELAELYLKAPEVTRRNTRVHFIQPLKERIVREVGYGLSLEGSSSADLVKSMRGTAAERTSPTS